MIENLYQIANDDSLLRPYQTNSKLDIYQAWKSSKSVLFQMPTGTGKTRLFVSIIKDIRKISVAKKIIPQPRILVLAHRTELIEQISDTLQSKYHITCGIIKSGIKENNDAIVQVASVQSLSRRLARWQDIPFQYIVIDEAHHALAATYKKICKTFPNAYILGVTATPYRLSGEGFRKMFGRLVTSMPVQSFIEQGYLSAFKYYSIPLNSKLQYDINNISEYGADGDYLERALCEICNTGHIRAKLVKAYHTYAKGKKGIVYTINKQHNKSVAEQYRAEGLRVADIDSDTPSEERKRIVNDFKNSKIDIICNVNIFSEGFDCPDLEFVQLARPTQSLSLYLQQVGRALRTSPNKSRAIILDNVGIYNKFGLPNQLIDWQRYFNLSENSLTRIISKAITNSATNTRKIKESDEDMILIKETSQSTKDNADEKYSLLGTISTMEEYPIGMYIEDMKNHIGWSISSSNFFREISPASYEHLEEYIIEMEDIYGVNEDGEDIDINCFNGRALYCSYKYEQNGKYGVCRIKDSFSSLDAIQEYISSNNTTPKFSDYFDIILEPIYDNLRIPNNGQLIIYCINNKYGVIDAINNRDLISCIYDEIEEFPYIGYIVSKKGKYGVIGYNGEFSVPMKYDGIFLVDPLKKWYICLKNGKLISLINSKEIHRMTECVGNISENYYISKFNINDCNSLIYAITNKDGEILYPTFADYIFFTENKDEICFQYKSRCIFTDPDLNSIRVENGIYHKKLLIPDFYFPKRLKKKQQVHEKQKQPKTNNETPSAPTSVTQKIKLDVLKSETSEQNNDILIIESEKQAKEIKVETLQQTTIQNIATNKKKRPRLYSSDLAKMKHSKNIE